MQILRRSGAPRILAAGMVIALTGCAAPSTVGGVASAQHKTISDLAISYAADLALLRDLVDRTLRERRVLLLGSLHREMLTRGYISPALEPSPDRFAGDLNDASQHAALIDEVRTGRMGAADAAAFLHDYALSLRMNDAGATRNALLARLSPVIVHDRGARSIRDAMDDRAEAIAALLADAEANAAAVAEFASLGVGAPSVTETTIRALWRRTVLEHIDEPDRRDAASRLLDRILDHATGDDHE